MLDFFITKKTVTHDKWGDELRKPKEVEYVNIPRIVGSVFGFLFGLTIIFGSFYTVPEGHVAIEKRFGKATVQTDPGLNFKVPFIDGYEEIEVRQRKNVEDLAAATQNQLPVTARVSINWTVDKSAAKDLYVEYGGLEQFENRVLDPKLRSSAKAAIASYPADQLIRNRNVAVAKIMEEMVESTKGLPITINAPQIENIALPDKYLKSVMDKEQAREAAEREKHNLARQKLEAQQKVQTAIAERDAKKAEADGNAYKTITEARAEAKAVRMLNAELGKSHNYVALVKAKRWNGVLPTHVLGEDTAAILK